MSRWSACCAVLVLATSAHADEATLRPQLQADLGLSVVGVGYEQPIAGQLAIQAEVTIFGTYVLPWFGVGDRVAGFGGGVRATWFARTSGRGLYVTPYVRADRVSGDLDGMKGSGVAIAAGAFVGWSFGLTDRLDLRIGGGAQYIYVDADPLAASTPFIALDAVLGYRM